MKQLFENFSWAAIWSLPPTEFLALVVLCVLAVLGAIGLFVGTLYLGSALAAGGEYRTRAQYVLVGLMFWASIAFVVFLF